MKRSEQQIFFDVLDRHLMSEALRCLHRPPWWVRKGWSNWNGVCAGGMGMMGLAFYDRHAGYVVFQMAEVAVPRQLFGKMLERIGRLRLGSG